MSLNHTWWSNCLKITTGKPGWKLNSVPTEKNLLELLSAPLRSLTWIHNKRIWHWTTTQPRPHGERWERAWGALLGGIVVWEGTRMQWTQTGIVQGTGVGFGGCVCRRKGSHGFFPTDTGSQKAQPYRPDTSMLCASPQALGFTIKQHLLWGDMFNLPSTTPLPSGMVMLSRG